MDDFEKLLDEIAETVIKGAKEIARRKKAGTYKPIMPDSSYGAGWRDSPERAAIIRKLEEEEDTDE